MINSTSTGQPTFSFLKCDNYPYYIPSIKGISYLSAPISTGVKVDVGSDEILCVLSGSLHMEVFPSFTKDVVVYNASKNDIFYFTCGMQKYKSLYLQRPKYQFISYGFRQSTQLTNKPPPYVYGFTYILTL